MLRFVVLEHRWQGVHWDFMLEDGPVMKTWALERTPDSAGSIPARALADHRLAFLEYEGPISQGRGSVTRWDRGTFQWRQRRDDCYEVELHGERLKGDAVLWAEAGQWTFRFQAQAPGAPSGPEDCGRRI